MCWSQPPGKHLSAKSKTMPKNIVVVHALDNYLSTTMNWIYNIISNFRKVQNVVVAKNYYKNNFYNNEITFIDFPLRTFRSVTGKNPASIVLRSTDFVMKNTIRFIYPLYIRRILKDQKPSILHAHFSYMGWEFLPVAKYLDIPLVVSFYGLDYEQLPHKKPKWKSRYKKLFGDASLILCEGHHGAQILMNMGCPKNKIKVVQLGVNVGKIPFYKRTKQANKLKLIQIATFREKKGYIYTIEAFAKASENCPNMTLTLVGGNEHNGIREMVDKRISELDIQDRVVIEDYVDFDTLYEFLKKFDVFIHPSCYAADRDCEGGAPIVLLDAQATGMPVISTKHCDIPSEVMDGETGVLCDEKDVEGLAKAIEYFYGLDEVEMHTYGLNARKHVEAHYDILKSSSHLEQVYEQLLEKK